jgi:hypothetical protein
MAKTIVEGIGMSTLEVIHERKICDLLPCQQTADRWEASGVLVKDQYYFVVFDDRGEVARIAGDLQANDANGLLGTGYTDHGYEGIAYNAAKQRFYLLVEARKHSRGCYKASIVECDNDFKYVKDRPIDFVFEHSNKGFEAIAHLRRDSRDYLLALCEGNKCKGGEKGRKPGGGRVLRFEKKKKRWLHSHTIALPRSLPFVDYSGMSVDGDRVAIVSQVNSMLWVGHLDQANWTWQNEGRLYEFPRSNNGAIRYGHIEGVAWIGPTRIVTVSDRRSKKNQLDDRLSEKDQSVHIFEVSS